MPNFYFAYRWQGLLGAGLAGLLTACAAVAPVDPAANQDIARGDGFACWRRRCRQFRQVAAPYLSRQKPTLYRTVWLDGRRAIRSESTSAASMLRYSLRVEPADMGKLRFSWKVPALIEGADLTQRDGDDSPVRVVLAFEGDRSSFSAKNAMLSELARALTGEELPYATLMYVWGNHREPGSVIINPRTDRIRKLVLESGPSQLNRWLDYERDIRVDYEKAFGEAPGALLAIGIMTDTDNTRGSALAWYGPVTLMADTPPKK